MKGRKRYIFAALLLYSLFLLATFPADRAFDLARQKVRIPEKSFKVGGLSGTWLCGTATSALIANQFTLTNVKWQIHLLPIFLGRFQARISSDIDGGNLEATVSAGNDDLIVRDVSALIPATIVNEVTAPFGIEISGRLAARIDDAVLAKGRLASINGVLDWQKAGLTGDQELVFGDIKAQLQTPDEEVMVTVSDGGGPLMFEGAGNLQPDGTYSFSGFVSVRQSAQPELGDAVRLIGESGSDGRVALSFNGRLANLKF